MSVSEYSMDFSAYISRGIALLKKNNADFNRVDLTTLDMRLENKCILGQIYGDYETGLLMLGILDYHEFLCDASWYGFTLADSLGSSPLWEDLTDQWKEFLKGMSS